ncbi:MAG: hypothetical protein ACYC39_06705 [Thiobacillus sp.]
MDDIPSQPMKRKLFALLAGLPLFTACVPAEVRAARKAGEEREKVYHDSLTPNEQAMLRRFRGIGIQLVVDAVAGAKMERVKVTNDLGYEIFDKATVSQGKLISDVGSARVPLWVRVTWRDGSGWSDFPVGDHRRTAYRQGPIPGTAEWVEGVIAGDYTIPVAERIPDEVVESLRKDPGMLRIKFRLHPNGVYFGWDIERRPGYKPGYSVSAMHDMPGGDFQEAKIFNGAVVRKGWYVDKNGQRIETVY